ncbi:MAG TPA: glycosyltransferase family 39 protein [Chloroflexota bacterium]|nr:glycosyltransferase family 39 protein [Chloroflexota bacterium]
MLLVAAFSRLYRLDELPAGLAPDIAFNGLDAHDVLTGHLPVFFPRNYGREALFVYFQTLILAGGGFTRFSFSYAGIALDMLAVATTYRLWRELFSFRVGVLAALFLGVFMWDVNMSRLGFRVSSLLPLLNATVYLLWRLVHIGERKYALLGGLTVGLSLYTYTSARLVPVLLAACLVCSWRLARKRLPLLGLAALTAAVVALPEGIYFLRHPAEFTMRTADVSLFEARPRGGESVGTAVLRSMGMFFVRGDINPTYNLIGRPVFERWEGVLFGLGLGFALAWMWRSAAARWSLSWLGGDARSCSAFHRQPQQHAGVGCSPRRTRLAGSGRGGRREGFAAGAACLRGAGLANRGCGGGA